MTILRIHGTHSENNDFVIRMNKVAVAANNEVSILTLSKIEHSNTCVYVQNSYVTLCIIYTTHVRLPYKLKSITIIYIRISTTN